MASMQQVVPMCLQESMFSRPAGDGALGLAVGICGGLVQGIILHASLLNSSLVGAGFGAARSPFTALGVPCGRGSALSSLNQLIRPELRSSQGIPESHRLSLRSLPVFHLWSGRLAIEKVRLHDSWRELDCRGVSLHKRNHLPDCAIRDSAADRLSGQSRYNSRERCTRSNGRPRNLAASRSVPILECPPVFSRMIPP